MKKSVIVILIIALMFVFVGASCDSNSNVSYNDTNSRLTIVHICDMGGNCVDYTIKQWYETTGAGIGFTTTDGNYIWCSEGTFIMASEYCPICGRK